MSSNYTANAKDSFAFIFHLLRGNWFGVLESAVSIATNNGLDPLKSCYRSVQEMAIADAQLKIELYGIDGCSGLGALDFTCKF